MSREQNLIYTIGFSVVGLLILIVFQSLKINFYLTSSVLILFALFAFFLAFEKKQIQAREIIVLAVLCAIATAGRVVFQVIPFVSFLVGFVIITAVSFGPNAGFICGAVSAFMSNISCGQGPWTPWQMFAFGMAGFIMGSLYCKQKKQVNKVILTILSFVVVFIVVGPLLDLSALFTVNQSMLFNITQYKALLATGWIANFIHATSVAICVYFLSEPMFDKLNRIKIKYGMMKVKDEI